MLEWLSNLFYDPWVFWGAPLVLAVMLEVGWRLRPRTSTGPAPRGRRKMNSNDGGR